MWRCQVFAHTHRFQDGNGNGSASKTHHTMRAVLGAAHNGQGVQW
jgi:hypothetical protein